MHLRDRDGGSAALVPPLKTRMPIRLGGGRAQSNTYASSPTKGETSAMRFSWQPAIPKQLKPARPTHDVSVLSSSGSSRSSTHSVPASSIHTSERATVATVVVLPSKPNHALHLQPRRSITRPAVSYQESADQLKTCRTSMWDTK